MTTQVVQQFCDVDAAEITVLLCDADGNLFPSEAPAFDASVTVTNRFLERFGLPGNCDPTELRRQTTGKNFRTTAVDLAVAGGIPVEEPLAGGRCDAIIASQDQLDSGQALTSAELGAWVQREKQVVTAHLGSTLSPDVDVLDPLEALGRRYKLAAVSSSASARLDACFTATGLDGVIPGAVRFSAEDSLPVPTSKPDPAVYLLAGQVLGLRPDQGLAIEDSVPGVLSAVAAGFPTVGNLMFVPADERACRSAELRNAGAAAIVQSWRQLTDVMRCSLQTTAP